MEGGSAGKFFFRSCTIGPYREQVVLRAWGYRTILILYTSYFALMFGISLSVLSPVIIMVTSALAGVIIAFRYAKNKNEMLGYFMLFFFGIFVMHIFLSSSSIAVVQGNIHLAAPLMMIALMALFFTLALFVYFPAKLVLPRIARIISYIFLAAATASSVIFLFNVPSHIQFINGLILWNMPQAPALANEILNTLVMAFSVIVFIIFGVKTKSVPYKMRSFVYALGFFVFLIGGPAHGIAKTALQYFLADITTAVGIVILFIAIYVPRMFGAHSVPLEQNATGEQTVPAGTTANLPQSPENSAAEKLDRWRKAENR